MPNIKPTSFRYGPEHQARMVEYYRQSKREADDNPEYLRVRLVKDLARAAHHQRLAGRAAADITVVDVGCSIGTFAIEFAKEGYRSYGVDFDESALTHARAFNQEEGTSATFLNMDISNWDHSECPLVDMAVCADIFEHLHDDELGAFLIAIRRSLSADGCLIFHTLPGEFDFMFWSSRLARMRLPWVFAPFAWLPDAAFTRVVRLAALSYDAARIAFSRAGLTYKESIKATGHPNPLTPQRLRDILERAGFSVAQMDTCSWDCQIPTRHRELFRSRSILHRSIFGIAYPKKPAPVPERQTGGEE